MTTDSADLRVVDIDLSRFSPPKPSFWRSNKAVPTVVLIVAVVWMLIAIVGAKSGGALQSLAVGLFILLFVGIILAGLFSIFVLMPKMLSQRATRSVVGEKVAVRPEDLAVVPPHFDRPMGEILAALTSFQAAPAAADPQTSTPKPTVSAATQMHANAYIAGAVGVGLLWVLLVIATHSAGILVDLAAIGLITWCLMRRRRVLAQGAEIVVRDDGRPPVLFLRSFKDDTVKLRQYQLWAGMQQVYKIRFEEALAGMVGPYGPFLAVGEPSEGLPQLGAARAYLADDQWQAQVLNWIAGSRLIAMLCGPTRWVHWEMQNIVAAGRMQNLLLFLPPGRKPQSQAERLRLERWDNIVRSLENTPYGPAMRSLRVDDVLLIQFGADSLRVYRSRTDLVQDYDLAASLAIYAILTTAPGADIAPAPTAPQPRTSHVPDPPRPAPTPPDDLMTAKFAAFGLLAGVIGLLFTHLGRAGPILSMLPVLALAITLAAALLHSRRPPFLGLLFGLLFAAFVINALIFRLAYLRFGVELFYSHGLVLLLVFLFQLLVFAAILAAGMKALRPMLSPLSLGLLAAVAVIEFVGLRLRFGPVGMILSLVRPTVMAGLVGMALSQRKPE